MSATALPALPNTTLSSETTMRAVIQERYGALGSLKVGRVKRPEIAHDQVLIKVMATSVHADVWHVIAGHPRVLRLFGSGLRRPKNPIPGTDVAGIVCRVGRDVTEFVVGDEVFGEASRKMQWQNGGTYAEYAAVPADTLVKKPANVSFEQAASVATAGYIVLINLTNHIEISRGDEVLVNGAGGAVGSVAVQYLKSRGARVTAVEHPSKLEFVKALGADVALDYTKGELDRCRGKFDLIFDVASNLSRATWTRLLQPDGKFVLIGHDQYGKKGHGWLGELPRFFGLMTCSLLDKRIPGAFSMPPKKPMMAALRDLMASGQLTPVVAQTFALCEVNEALSLLMRGETLGRLVLVPGRVS
jgi:NADPH:quinone reductase-like Zn-dependent oxidoreductase